ncbi:hypothetical protein PPBDW_I20132 [Photobacterium kishitanii]|nr:hypothetical protein PPBDW_I20132 [Photobacterium kishitanii]
MTDNRPCYSYLVPSTGLEPVTYGLAVRQASHKVSPTERRGNY